MFTRISLLYPPTFESQWGAIRPPVGLGYLSEQLLQANIAHQVLDLSLGDPVNVTVQKIRAFQTDLIGVSMTSLFHQAVYDLMRELKQQFPQIPIVVGGPHVSTLRQQALTECAAIDFGVTLEGEETLLDLCQGAPLANIKGLLYRDASGGLVYTGDRALIAELDRLPFPTYAKFALDRYVAREIGIITSRGCPYRCTFCPVKTTIGRTCRFRRAANVADELAYWHERGYRDILILDDNFAMQQDRVYALCDEIEQRGLTGLRLRCGNGIRADHVDEALLRRMYAVGFRFLSFGVESANEHVLTRVQKGETLAKIETAVKLACDIGYDVTLFFIIGLPGETAHDVERSFAFAQRYPVFDAKFYNLIPFPHTEIFDWIEAQRYFLARPETYLNQASHWDTAPLFETPEFPRAERIKMLEQAHRVRRQIRQAAMQRKLKKFGLLSAPLASIFVSDEVQDALLHNRHIRRIAEMLFRLFVESKTTPR